MDERDKRRVGEQIEPGGRPKAPGRLELLQRFVNTHNHDLPLEWDRIGSAETAQRWLREKRLVAARDRVSDADAARLRELREAIRALAVANQGAPPDPAALDAIHGVSVRPGSASPSTARGARPSSGRAAASTAPWRRSSASCTRRSSPASGCA